MQLRLALDAAGRGIRPHHLARRIRRLGGQLRQRARVAVQVQGVLGEVEVEILLRQPPGSQPTDERQLHDLLPHLTRQLPQTAGVRTRRFQVRGRGGGVALTFRQLAAQVRPDLAARDLLQPAGTVAVVDRAEAGAVADLQLLTVLDRLVQPAGRPAQRGPGVLAEPHAGSQRRGEAAAGAVGIARIDAVGRHPVHPPVRVHDSIVRALPAEVAALDDDDGVVLPCQRLRLGDGGVVVGGGILPSQDGEFWDVRGDDVHVRDQAAHRFFRVLFQQAVPRAGDHDRVEDDDGRRVVAQRLPDEGDGRGVAEHADLDGVDGDVPEDGVELLADEVVVDLRDGLHAVGVLGDQGGDDGHAEAAGRCDGLQVRSLARATCGVGARDGEHARDRGGWVGGVGGVGSAGLGGLGGQIRVLHDASIPSLVRTRSGSKGVFSAASTVGGEHLPPAYVRGLRAVGAAPLALFLTCGSTA